MSKHFCFRIVILMSALSLWCGAFAHAQESSASDSSSEAELKAVEAGSTAEIHVKNADIAAIVKIFSKKTKRNYILDERVKGKVSLYIPGKVSPGESLRILEALLSLKGFTSVPVGENLWKIIPTKDAKQTTIPTKSKSSDEPASAAVVTRLVKLNYVGAEEAQQIVSQLVSPDGLVNAYAGTNSLIIIDSEDNVERLIKILEEIDIPFTDRDMTIIPIQYADAKEIAEKLTELLNEGSSDKATSSDAGGLDLVRARMRENAIAAAGGNMAAAGTPISTSPTGRGSSASMTARARAPKISHDERTNSVIVVADEDTTARIRALISKLDSRVDLSGNRFYVYRCQHATATALAEVLAGLVGQGSGSSGSSSTSTSSGFGQTGSTTASASRNSASTQDRLSSQRRIPGESRRSDDSGGGASSVSLGESGSITADPATNSLIISASKTDYLKIKALLEELDIKRRQVLVEALLLEVEVNDNQSLGTEFLTSAGGADGGILAKSDFGNLSSLLSDPASLSNFSIAAASSGTLKLPGNISIPTQAILLSAAKKNENVNILSSPTILAVDNEEAEIVVGNNIPFVTSTSSNETNLNNTFNQVERQDVGITLRLTPQISSGDFVTLSIFTEVSNVIEASLTSRLGPSTSIKTSETKVVTKSGQMVVIGGLMSDAISDSEDGVPFFKDIPVIGSAFRSRGESRRRRNLLIFITPKVIQDQFDARDATVEHRDSFEDQIREHDLQPSREEVLRDPHIDRVAEGGVFDGQKPSTIRTPPKAAASTTAKGVSTKIDASGSETIKLRITPRLPDAAPRDEARRDSAQYLVFEISELNGVDASTLPFSRDESGSVFGMVVPSDAGPDAKRFFTTGGKYKYHLNGKEVDCRVVGIFATIDDARVVHKSLPREWYTLSPYEIMNIGTRPWSSLS